MSGYIGGWLHDEMTDVDVDGGGNVYVTGWTGSRDFATGNPLFGWDEWNALCPGFETCVDAFVAKYAPGGRSLVYLTLLSGDRDDLGNAIAAGSSGHAYVAGDTDSTDFPTRNAAQPTLGTAFVAKLAPDGAALEWSTNHGGGYHDEAHDIAVDAAGNAYATGYTEAMDFPTTPGAADRVCSRDTYAPRCRETWVAKYTSAGAVVYSTLFGGDNAGEFARGIAVDRAGRAVIGGFVSGASDFPVTPGSYDTTPDPYFTESFAARFNAAGSAVEWATTFGGEDWDDAQALALDAQDRPVVVGTTESPDFPTTPGALDRQCTTSDERWACTNQSDGFLTKLAANGSALVWSTFLGGTGYDTANGVDVDSRGDVLVTGQASTEYAFPLKDAFQWEEASTELSCGVRAWCSDAYFLRLSEAGGLVAGTLLGGGSHDVGSGVAAEPDGDAWVAGLAHSRNFPVSADSVQPVQAGGNCEGGWYEFPECRDGFLTEIRSRPAPAPTPTPTPTPTRTPTPIATSTPDPTSTPESGLPTIGATLTPLSPTVAEESATAIDRRLTAHRRGRALAGRLRADDEACAGGARVVLERRVRGRWRTGRAVRGRAPTGGSGSRCRRAAAPTGCAFPRARPARPPTRAPSSRGRPRPRRRRPGR